GATGCLKDFAANLPIRKGLGDRESCANRRPLGRRPRIRHSPTAGASQEPQEPRGHPSAKECEHLHCRRTLSPGLLVHTHTPEFVPWSVSGAAERVCFCALALEQSPLALAGGLPRWCRSQQTRNFDNEFASVLAWPSAG